MRAFLLIALVVAQVAVFFYEWPAQTQPVVPPPAPAEKTYLPLFGLDRKKNAASAEWEARRMRRLERELEGLRDLAFKHPVPSSPQTVEELNAFIRKELDREKNLHETEIAYKALGFIPESASLKDLYLAFYASQIAGYYDPETGQFHTITRTGLMTNLLSGGEDELELIMIHELDHALTDQHFHLKKLEKRAAAARNDDEALAIQSVIEGDAMAVMMHAQNVRMFGPDQMNAAYPSSAFETYAELIEWVNFDPAWRNAPRLFRKLNLFPYLAGGAFIDAVRVERGGWPVIDDLYLHPPLSSEQILHPEKFPNEMPVRVAPPSLKTGFRKATENTAGEEIVRLWLEEHGVDPAFAQRAAAGWGGDRYVVGDGARNARILAWKTVWDTPGDAKEFEGVARQALKHARKPFRLSRDGRQVVIEQGPWLPGGNP